MKQIIFGLLVTMTALLMGQEESQKSDIEKAVQVLDDQIIKYEATEGTIMMEMNEIDVNLEKKLEILLKHLIKTRDSSETGTLVIRNKKKIIRDLQNAQEAYKTGRENIDKIFKTDTELIGHDIYSLKKLMDEKINERIKQITKVTDSLAGYKEYYDWDGRYNDRRNVETADREKNRVLRDFEKEIAELNKKAKKIDDGFSYSDSKERLINTYSEMQTINERVNLLEHSIEDILNGGDDGKKIGKVAGLRLDREVRKVNSEVNGYLKSFFYALSSYQRVLHQRKELTVKVNKLKAAINK